MAFSVPAEQTVGSDHWYNFTVQSAGADIHINNLIFQVQSSNGSLVAPGSGWTLTALNSVGVWIGTYSLTGATAGTWALGGNNPLRSGETINLLATPTELSGDTLVVMVTGSLSNGCPLGGSLTVSIP